MWRAGVVLAGLAMIVGCDPGAPGGPAVDAVTAPPKFLVVPGGAERTYDEGDTVTLVAHYPSGVGASQNVITAAETAVARWNNEVLWPYGLYRLAAAAMDAADGAW